MNNLSPTPWKAEGWQNAIINDANGHTIALAPGANRGLWTMRANASLIAAAPELLEALEALEIAAANRENTMGDPCRSLECKAELANAARHALTVIKKAKAGWIK